ncbi:MAG: indolepyruvate ferredoxin oxidoreductase [Methanospirillaceae archaeon]|nr:indolepyruvate ferredoxin oxidoreductase [Methanospirillaceae archaeon]
MNGEERLILDLKQNADRMYGIPGYPVSGLVAGTGAQSVINEKVALEYALGDSLHGRRAAVIVKHVGVNTLADPLVNATSQGLIGGVIIIAGDDPLVTSSTVIEYSASFGPVAGVPVITCRTNGSDAVKEAFLASEQFSRVALLTIQPHDLTREVSDPHRSGSPDTGNKSEEKRSAGRLADPDGTMYGRAVAASEYYDAISSRGMIPEGCRYPVPEPGGRRSKKERGYSLTLCADCPYQPLFCILQERGERVICDTGCSILAMNEPYRFGYASYGMGSAVAVAATSTGIALIGDYGMLHSGLSALIDVYEKKLPLLCIIMQNNCMGMTGGQPVVNLLPYIGFAEPVVVSAGDATALKKALSNQKRPCTVVVSGQCPQEIHHETFTC